MGYVRAWLDAEAATLERQAEQEAARQTLQAPRVGGARRYQEGGEDRQPNSLRFSPHRKTVFGVGIRSPRVLRMDNPLPGFGYRASFRVRMLMRQVERPTLSAKNFA